MPGATEGVPYRTHSIERALAAALAARRLEPGPRKSGHQLGELLFAQVVSPFAPAAKDRQPLLRGDNFPPGAAERIFAPGATLFVKHEDLGRGGRDPTP